MYAIEETEFILGNKRPEELVKYEEEKKNQGFFEKKFFDLWLVCQAWDNAGKITLPTLKQCCEDLNIPYCKETRNIILTIENIYRGKNG